jgi:hypothetical protein
MWWHILVKLAQTPKMCQDNPLKPANDIGLFNWMFLFIVTSQKIPQVSSSKYAASLFHDSLSEDRLLRARLETRLNGNPAKCLAHLKLYH